MRHSILFSDSRMVNRRLIFGFSSFFGSQIYVFGGLCRSEFHATQNHMFYRQIYSNTEAAFSSLLISKLLILGDAFFAFRSMLCFHFSARERNKTKNHRTFNLACDTEGKSYAFAKARLFRVDHLRDALTKAYN